MPGRLQSASVSSSICYLIYGAVYSIPSPSRGEQRHEVETTRITAQTGRAVSRRTAVVAGGVRAK
jgi:hypothetical protein